MHFSLPEGIAEVAIGVQVNHQGKKDAHPDSYIFPSKCKDETVKGQAHTYYF